MQNNQTLENMQSKAIKMTVRYTFDECVSKLVGITANCMLESARQQADAASLVDSKYFAAGPDSYTSFEGQKAKREAEQTESRVVDLEQLVVPQADDNSDVPANMRDWCHILNHFGRSLNAGTV